LTICHRCDTEIPNGKAKCISCGAWTFSNSTIDTESDTQAPLLSEVTSAETQRIDVGPWNRLFGGKEDKKKKGLNPSWRRYMPGLANASVIILGGKQGGGKSTAALQLLDYVCGDTSKDDREGMCLASEERLEDIKARADRLQIKNQHKIRMVSCMGGGVDVNYKLMTYKPKIVFIDSLAGIAGDSDEQAITICHVCKQYATLLNAPVILNHHVTKGDEIAGQNTLQHAVDTVITLFPFDPDNPNPELKELRVFRVDPKNRYGQAFIEEYFLMTETGLIWVDPESIEDEGEDE
jgi:predicted ATP-dependent serine protease